MNLYCIKNEDVKDHDYYRPLAIRAITCIDSKVFELVILHKYGKFLETTANQFGCLVNSVCCH